MKTIFEHIEYAKSQPHHIRKRIAFAAAAAFTAVVAVVWFFGTLSSGAFALQGSSFADSTGAESAVATSTNPDSSEGMAAAAAAIPDDTNAPAHIEIVDTATSSSATSTAEQTTIPF
jgi:hypothetical protein